MHTEQVILANGSSTSIAEAATVGVTRALEVTLPDARAALAYRRSVLGTATGDYNLATNSCLTHCGDVLRAGGVSGVHLIHAELCDDFDQCSVISEGGL